MRTSNNSSAGGMGLASVLTVVFVTLKLLDKIDWSWWWVLSPLWISLALFLVIILVFVIVKIAP